MSLEDIIRQDFSELISEDKDRAMLLWKEIGDKMGLNVNTSPGRTQVIQFGLPNRPGKKRKDIKPEVSSKEVQIPKFD